MDIIARMMTSSNSSQLADVTTYETILAIDDTFSLDLNNAPVKNFSLTLSDTVEKTIALSNIPTRCELVIEVIATNAAIVNFPASFSWLGGTAPEFAEGGVYYISAMTRDGGTSFNAFSVGDWIGGAQG